MTQYLTLSIYDVADDKRRSKLVKVMEYYGIRVQESAFEAILAPSQCNRMIERALACLNLEIRAYGIGDVKRDDCYVI